MSSDRLRNSQYLTLPMGRVDTAGARLYGWMVTHALSSERATLTISAPQFWKEVFGEPRHPTRDEILDVLALCGSATVLRFEGNECVYTHLFARVRFNAKDSSFYFQLNDAPSTETAEVTP